MRLRATHRWDLGTAQARALQEELASRVCLEDFPGEPRTVTGVDVAYDRPRGLALAVAVTFAFPEMQELEEARAEVPVTFPYIPGLLSFREGPAVLAALERLRREPDLLILDAQGIAHPRGIGLASHIGVVTGVPSIGAAKSRLVGEHAEPGRRRGAQAPLFLQGREVGRVVRTRQGVRPLYVSPGHRVSLERAAELVLRCCTRYRLPEPTRQADLRLRATPRGGSRK